METELVACTLNRALVVRKPSPGWIHHSNRGSPYCSRLYQEQLREAGARVSMSRRGNCWDNAVVESFFRTLKEELAPARWKTEAACRKAIGAWIHSLKKTCGGSRRHVLRPEWSVKRVQVHILIDRFRKPQLCSIFESG